MQDKSYFGIAVSDYGIKIEDISMIPFDEHWDTIATTHLGSKYLSTKDWESYAQAYIKKNNLIFPKGVYVCEYTFPEMTTYESHELNNIQIIINSKHYLDESRHIRVKNSNLDTTV